MTQSSANKKKKTAKKKRPTTVAGRAARKGLPAHRPRSESVPLDPHEVALRAALAGQTDIQIAALVGVSEKTLNEWKNRDPEFAAALRSAKSLPDDQVERSLFQRANGYSHSDTDIRVIENQIVKTPIVKHYPPDTTAAIFWLKCRRPDRWRDKDSVDDRTVLNINIQWLDHEPKRGAVVAEQ